MGRMFDVAGGPSAPRIVHHEADRATVLRGGTLIDGSGRPPVDHAVVVIRGDRIIDVGRETDTTVPEGKDVSIVDTTGKWIIPGLIEAHTHVTGEISSNPYSRYLYPPKETRAVRALLDLFRTLQVGFTTVRDMGIPGPAFALREAIRLGWVPGPRIFTAGGALSPTGGHGDVHQFSYERVQREGWRGFLVDGVETCRWAVRRNLRDGADFIKVFASSTVTESSGMVRFSSDLSPDELRATVEEAHALGVKVAAHACGAEAVSKVIDAGVDTIEHGALAGEYHLLERMADRGIVLVPTFSIWHWMATTGQDWGLPSARVAAARHILELTMETVGRARACGVQIAAGADTESKVGVSENALELEFLVQAGLSPLEALVSATKIGAKALAVDHALGCLESGKIGELLILRINPLEDIARLRRPGAVEMIFLSRDPVRNQYRW